ncbi:mCG145508 [Mus musculus]|nr:mCG145508 [Mus musculus]
MSMFQVTYGPRPRPMAPSIKDTQISSVEFMFYFSTKFREIVTKVSMLQRCTAA